MEFLLITSFCAIMLIVVALLIRRILRQKVKDDSWEQISPSKPFVTFSKWAESRGDVYTVNLGSRQALVLNSIEAAREALLTNNKAFSGRPQFKTLDFLHQDEKKFVFAAHCDSLLKFCRKTVLCDARKRCAQLDGLVEQQVSAMDEEIFAHNESEVDVDLRSVVHRMATNFAHGIAFGTTFDLSDPLLHQWEEGLDEYRDLMHWFRPENFLPVSMETFKTRVKTFREYSAGMYKRSIDQAKGMEKADGLVAALLDIFDGEKNPNAENVDDVISMLRDVMFGCSDGSFQPLVWMVMYAAKYPAIQRRIHAEIDEALESPNPGATPYTEACIREVLRHSELTTLGIPRNLERDVTIGNQSFAKDTIAIVNVFAIHRDPRHWEAPEVFDPNRFMDNSGKLRPISELSYLPFSTGQRACVGQQLARNLLLKLFLKFFQTYSVGEVASDPIPETVNAGGAFNPELKAFKVRLSKRIL